MKHSILITVSLLVTVLVNAQKGFVVEGTVKGLTNDSIHLVKVYDGKPLYSTIAKDGQFIFKHEGKFLGDKVMLSGAGMKNRTAFYIEPGKIKIEGDLKAIAISGTPSNDAQNKYNSEVAPLDARVGDSRRKLREAKDPVEKERLTKLVTLQLDSFYSFRRTFARQHNNTILAPEFLSAGTGGLTYADMKELIGALDPKTPENWYTNRLKKRGEVLGQTDFGKKLPDFTLPDTSGSPVRFSSLKGKIVLVDFWASWCAPCREENQNVRKLYEKYSKDGFDVISVSIDDKKEKWTAAIVQDKLPWYHVSSLTGWDCPTANSLGVTYGMSGVPYTLLVGRDGRVIGHNVRGVKLEEKLAELFSQKSMKGF